MILGFIMRASNLQQRVPLQLTTQYYLLNSEHVSEPTSLHLPSQMWQSEQGNFPINTFYSRLSLISHYDSIITPHTSVLNYTLHKFFMSYHTFMFNSQWALVGRGLSRTSYDLRTLITPNASSVDAPTNTTPNLYLNKLWFKDQRRQNTRTVRTKVFSTRSVLVARSPERTVKASTARFILRICPQYKSSFVTKFLRSQHTRYSRRSLQQRKTYFWGPKKFSLVTFLNYWHGAYFKTEKARNLFSRSIAAAPKESFWSKTRYDIAFDKPWRFLNNRGSWSETLPFSVETLAEDFLTTNNSRPTFKKSRFSWKAPLLSNTVSLPGQYTKRIYYCSNPATHLNNFIPKSESRLNAQHKGLLTTYKAFKVSTTQPQPRQLKTFSTLKSLIPNQVVITTQRVLFTKHHIMRTCVPAALYIPYIKPMLATRTKLTFILTMPIMLFLKPLLVNQKNPFTYRYVFKKQLFSFLYRSEVRNALRAKQRNNMFYNLIHSTQRSFNLAQRYSPKNFRESHLSYVKLTRLYRSLHKDSNQSITTTGRGFSAEWDEIVSPEFFSYRGGDPSFKQLEVRVPRVQFRPGYQRLWRKARTALKDSLMVKFKYQKSLTKYLVRFYRQATYYTFSMSESSLQKMLMYSRLLPDVPTIDLFWRQNLIYLNGHTAPTLEAPVLENDLIQLIVTPWFYIAYRWITNWVLNRQRRFKRLVYRKGLASKQKLIKLKKQRSYLSPKWVYLTRYDQSDIKPYLEVDYFTLSCFVIYNPYVYQYHTPDDTPDMRSLIYRLYNWKYIT